MKREHGRVDLNAIRAQVRAANIVTIDLSRSDDARWTGVTAMSSYSACKLDASARHDVLVLEGELSGPTFTLHAGDYLRTGGGELMTGAEGAIAFRYREATSRVVAEKIVKAVDCEWSRGAAEGLQVSVFSDEDHFSALVEWQPGARVRAHAHAFGEEIFVMRGMLCDEQGRYPAGSWLRLHPGAVHAPYCEQPTLILLRNGHLGATPTQL